MAGLLPNINQNDSQGRVRSANDFAPATGLGAQSLPASTPGMMSLGKGNVNTQGRTGGGGMFGLSQAAQPRPVQPPRPAQTPQGGLLQGAATRPMNPQAEQVAVNGRVTNQLTDEGRFGLSIDDNYQNQFGLNGKEKNNYLNQMRQAVIQGDNQVFGTEGNRNYQQQQAFNQLARIQQSNPDWRKQTEQNLKLNVLAELSGVKPGNQRNQQAVRWFQQNNPDWQEQASRFKEAYSAQMQAAKANDLRYQYFDPTALGAAWH